MKVSRRRFLNKGLTLGVTALLLVVSSPGWADEPARKVRVATDPTWPPMEMLVDGRIVGFDIDLMQAVALESRIEVEFVNVPFMELMWDFKKYDAVISAVPLLEGWPGGCDVTIPYLSYGQAILVRSDVKGVSRLADLAGRKIGTHEASMAHASGLIGGADRELALVEVAFDEYATGITALVRGDIDAFVADSPVAAWYAAKNPAYRGKLKVVGERLTDEAYTIVVKKGNAEILDLLNRSLKKLIEDGTRDALARKWIE
jgi:ABC-type amino acid transport substrate-binding protein